jgi:hypothetical protein
LVKLKWSYIREDGPAVRCQKSVILERAVIR